jgi:IS605 OrfB family transposase
MAERNTPLVNEVVRKLPEHPDFLTWQQRGKLPDEPIKTLVDSLKADPRFSEQPIWYYISAQKQVTYTFRSWLSLQRRNQWRVESKRRWLNILRPDSELAEKAKCSLEKLQDTAQSILGQIDAPDPFKWLMQEYGRTKAAKRQMVLAYLLKRSGKLEPVKEDLEKLAQRYRKTEIAIRRLEIQLKASLPKGRDLTGQAHDLALEQATTAPPLDDESYGTWHQALAREPAKFPFPIIYETVECLTWSIDDRGRILVRFSGKGTGDHVFKIYCDKPHQHWFERFLDDQETKKSSGDQHSAGLFTLRSVKLAWVPSKAYQKELEPWNCYHLTLACTVDTRLWTQEGTQVVKEEKAAGTAAKLQSMHAKTALTKNQQGYIRRLESTLDRLNAPYPRPSRPLYQGKANILVGVAMGLEKPATLAVVNVLTQELLVYRSIKQLLGEHYRLLQQARTEKAKTSHQGHRQRRKGGKRIAQESNLGSYVDRLLAKAIVEIAQQYQAGSIVLPDLKHVREIVEAEVGHRAAVRVPDFVDGQKQYAKAYRTQVHRWTYNRLQQFVTSKAEQYGLGIEVVSQSHLGSPQEKAKELALQAYEKRLAALS